MSVFARATPADRLSAAFNRAVRRPASATPVVGLEHEYRVLADGRQVDFRRLLGRLPIDGVRLDPADPNAMRGPWGGAITADGREAEVAIAPVTLEPGFSAAALLRAHRERTRLEAGLPAGVVLEGFSTHISVEVPDRMADAAALRFARTFAPALMLLLDAPESPGLLVRPRHGRIELCGEFADGDRLRAATIFATGAALAAARAPWRRPWARRRRPAAIRLEIEPATERVGWFVGRGAVGSDLYEGARDARLRLARGGWIPAQEHLERCWAASRGMLVGRVAAGELDLVDAFVRGDRELGLEIAHERAIEIDATPISPVASTPDSPFGSAIATRHLGGLRVEPAVVSWDFVVLQITDERDAEPRRVAFACLPRSALGAGLEELDGGRLDGLLRAYLEVPDDPRLLASAGQTTEPGLFRAVGASARLLASERGPTGPGERPGKRRRDEPDERGQPPARPSPRPDQPANAPALAAAGTAGLLLGLPVWTIVAALAVAGVAAVGGMTLLSGGPPATSAGPTPTQFVVAPSVGASLAPPSLVPPTLLPTEPPIVPDFAIGTAQLAATGDSVGETELVFAGESESGVPDGELFPTLAWANADATEVLGITLPARHATGTFSTADGTLGVGVALSVVDPFFGTTEDYSTGFGLGHDDLTAPAQPCTATITSTTDGGIAGTLSCPNVNGSSDFVIAIEATFGAEPDPAGATANDGKALGCADFLSPKEILDLTGRAVEEGVETQPMSPGETTCVYALDEGSLMLSIYRQPDYKEFYVSTVSSMPNSIPVGGLGTDAEYGDGPPSFGGDALAVLDDPDATFTLYSPKAPLGEDALQALAEILIDRVSGTQLGGA